MKNWKVFLVIIESAFCMIYDLIDTLLLNIEVTF